MTGVEDERAPAEFDPLGNSVGVQNPYPTMPPISQGEGCIGCGSSGIMSIDDNSPLYVNGQRMSFAIDGVSVTQSQFRSHLNLMLTASGYSSGGLGLAEHAAALSSQVTVTHPNEEVIGTYANGRSIPREHFPGIRTGEFFVEYTHSNWSPISALLS